VTVDLPIVGTVVLPIVATGRADRARALVDPVDLAAVVAAETGIVTGTATADRAVMDRLPTATATSQRTAPTEPSAVVVAAAKAAARVAATSNNNSKVDLVVRALKAHKAARSKVAAAVVATAAAADAAADAVDATASSVPDSSKDRVKASSRVKADGVVTTAAATATSRSGQPARWMPRDKVAIPTSPSAA
jgi:hypothetical protein